MKKGDLIQKVGGYGHDQNWTGVVLKIFTNGRGHNMVEVLTTDGIEEWVTIMVKVINERR